MKTKYLTSLLLLVVACSGARTTGGTGGETTLELKKAAADAKASDTAQGDVCQEHGWYGDGECDRFCPGVDSVDCTPTVDEPQVACALFLEEANGVCSRKAEDPCIGQDPDCETMKPLPSDPSDEPIACTTIDRGVDGVCADDPCAIYQDPDCAGGGAMPTEPSVPIVCPDIASVADGVCTSDASDPCVFYSDPDCQPSNPNTPGCTPPAEPVYGVCSHEQDGPCGIVDPDCEVACDLYAELPDGECKRAPSDPCIFQDPDCHAK